MKNECGATHHVNSVGCWVCHRICTGQCAHAGVRAHDVPQDLSSHYDHRYAQWFGLNFKLVMCCICGHAGASNNRNPIDDC